MQANLIDCTNLGMVRDTAISKVSGDKAEFAYDNRNIRITVNQDNTALSVTNEKGTERKLSISGTLLGQCILNNQLILFVKDTIQMPHKDCIIKVIEDDNTYKSEYLYSGNLNFSLNYPIETLGYYESESVQKVYWVDGLNPTRFINIASTKIQTNNDTQFDCKGTIYKVPNVTITKDYSEIGNFTGGTVQYFITYYNKFGTETGIVWQSDLQYTSKYDRGCKEGEQAQCVFKLNISNVDTTNYEYLRIYATHRSSQNGTPLTYIVADLDTSILNETISYTDNGTGLTAFPTEDLRFIGGETVIASTLDQKDDTLFLGDITLPKTIIPTDSNLYTTLTNRQKEVYESGNVIIPTSSLDISFSYKSLPTPEFKGTYSHKNQLDESQEEIAGFKYREVYRFAVQFQTTKGEWTNPIYIGDKYCDLPPKLENGTYQIAQAQYKMNSNAVAALTQWNSDNTHDGFLNVRLLVAEVTNLDRRILAQGVINPTMFNYYDRLQNKPYSINSWMFRPRQSQLTNRHYECMKVQSDQFAEIQGITKTPSPSFDPTNQDGSENSYALLIGLTGDWISNCSVAYVWYKYANDGYIDTYDDTEHGKILHPNQGFHNTIISSGYGAKKFSSKKEARQWLFECLSKDLELTDAMVPTENELKDMARANALTDNPDAVWKIVGASIATIASVVLAVLTVGAGAGASIILSGSAWGAAIAAMSTVGAAAGVSGVAAIAQQLDDAPDIDKEFAKKGFYTLLPQFNHSNQNKKEFENQYKSWIDGLFKQTTTPQYNQKFISFLNDSSALNGATLIQQVGRLNFKTAKELDAEHQREQYYVDESVLTLNSPDLDTTEVIINDSQALRLDLIGTIPINAVQGDSVMYTNTNGVFQYADAIPKIVVKGYDTTDVEGLISSAYQDITLDNWIAVDNKWPNISPSINLDSYKTFMWHRDTSWSCYIPGVNIEDPMGLNLSDTETKPLLQYIPAIPRKKVIANLRYSANTNYQSEIHSISIESPKVFNSGYDGLTRFTSNDTQRNYYGNCDTLCLNLDGYILLKSNGKPMWTGYNKYTGEYTNTVPTVYDPVHIKYNSSSHIVIPTLWKDEQVILPYTQNEKQVHLLNYYNDITLNSIIEGLPLYQSGLILYQLSTTNGVLYGNTTGDNTLEFAEQWNIVETLSPGITVALESELVIGDTVLQLTVDQTISLKQAIIDKVFFDKTKTFYDAISQHYAIFEDGKWVEKHTNTIDNTEHILYEFVSTNVDVNNLVSEISDYDPKTQEALYNAWLDVIKSSYPKPSFTHNNDTQINTWKQTQLSWVEDHPYLFIGELVKQYVDYDNWLGGISQQALEQLTWNVCSGNVKLILDTNIDFGDQVMPLSLEPQLDNIEGGLEGNPIEINKISITKTWGDTYYQRWDCMKTFPTTEEDKNSVVDILSFMVESHQNLDGRCDVNRGIINLVNARPTNFNLFNDAYNQTDNLFQYKILDTKFEDNTQENQVVWSLTKNILDDIDKWTQISTVNYLNLNGTYGRLRKIINVNDVLLAFQDTGISTINYNQKAAMSTVEGIPVQLGNTNKVDGYTTVSNKIGCHNKWSINLNSTGLYFIDDYNQSLNRYSAQNGIESISNLQGFTQWCKDNINGTIWTPKNYTAFKLSFDELTKDLYIINDKEALVYNAQLQRFVSFMDYPKCPLITNYQLNSIALHQDRFGIELYKMFTGYYNNLLGVQQPYWITYRLNPSAYTDNLFTNFTYIADIIPAGTSLDNTDITSTAHQTFTSVEAWNEYQHGMLDLTTVKNRHRHSKDRFRIWRGDIPRDGDTRTKHINGGNRMRNPWLYFKLHKDTTGDTNKMVFHNLTVTYYK